MKKYFKIMSLVLSICLLSLNVGFNTYALENDTLYYQGVAIEQKELSEDTLEWLGWYNSLSPDEQDCINYEPLDLQKMIVNPEDITVSEPELDELDIDDIVPFRLGAPVYNPSWWNNSNRIKKANCYAYSMDLIQNFVGKLQPGQLSGRIYESLSESSIFSAVVRDGSRLGGGRYIRRSSSSECPGSGEYKVVLVITPNRDYHWYVLNTNGYWSHKRGHSRVTNVDASEKRITNPKTCNRNYGSLNYSVFCGFYIVKRG